MKLHLALCAILAVALLCGCITDRWLNKPEFHTGSAVYIAAAPSPGLNPGICIKVNNGPIVCKGNTEYVDNAPQTIGQKVCMNSWAQYSDWEIVNGCAGAQ